MSEWPPRSPATPPFSPRRSPWTSCETRSFELRGAAMPSRERVRPIPPRRPCHSSHTARRNAHCHFLAHASRSGWPGQGDGGWELPIDTDDAHITNREPSSLPFPHAYTPLRCCRRPPSASSFGAIPSAVVHVRAGLFARGRPAAIGRQVRRDSGPPARTSYRTHPRLGALLGRPACVP